MANTAVDSGPAHAGVAQTLREMPRVARFVLLGVFINQFGAFLQFFMVLYLTHRGFSGTQAGIALGGYAIGAIIGVLSGGGYADRFGARTTIMFATGASAIFTVSVVWLNSLPAIVVAVALAGAVTQAVRPAASALLLRIVPESRRVMTFSIYTTVLNVGVISGPLVASWLSTINWDLVFIVDAVTSLAYCAVATYLLPENMPGEPINTPAASAAAKTDQEGGYRRLLRDRRYLAYLAIMLANGLVYIQFFAVLPLQMTKDGYHTWAYGTAGTVGAAVVVSTGLLITKRTQKWPIWVAVLTGWVCLVFGRGAYGLMGGLALILAGTVLATIGQAIGGPSAFSYPAKVAPPDLLGRYVGSAYAMFQIGNAIGPTIGVLLWTQLHRSFWLVVVVFGLLMVIPGAWGMAPAGTFTGPKVREWLRSRLVADLPKPAPATASAAATHGPEAGPLEPGAGGPGDGQPADGEPLTPAGPARIPSVPLLTGGRGRVDAPVGSVGSSAVGVLDRPAPEADEPGIKVDATTKTSVTAAGDATTTTTTSGTQTVTTTEAGDTVATTTSSGDATTTTTVAGDQTTTTTVTDGEATTVIKSSAATGAVTTTTTTRGGVATTTTTVGGITTTTTTAGVTTTRTHPNGEISTTTNPRT